MRHLDTDIWVAESPLRFGGVDIGARMTVLRLPGDRLLLHSPISISDELRKEVDELGQVAVLIAPNKFHHLFIGDWKQAYPDASLYVAPGLETKRSDLEITGVLGNEPEAGWVDTVDQVRVDGFKLANEIDFFHRPTQTLILTDLAFNICADSPLLTRIGFRMMRAYGRLTPTVLERLFVRDKTAFRSSLEQILEWPFERVVMSHGSISESGGREQLRRGYDWVL